jgi:hypothetical protein
MAQLSVEDALHRSESAWTIRDMWKGIIQDAYELAMPGRNPYVGNDKSPKPMNQMLDSTAMTSVFKLANRILMELLPPDDTWVGLEIGPLLEIQLGDNKKAIEQANKELEKVVKMIALPLSEPAFSGAAVEAILDMLVAGLGAMMILENKKNKLKPAIFQNVSQAEIAIDEGPDGMVEGVFRRRKIKIRMIERLWPDAVIPAFVQQMKRNAKGKDPEIDIEELTYYAGGDEEGSGPNWKPWCYEVIVKDGKNGVRMVDRTYRSNPWIIWRWFKVPGCPNKVVEMILTNAAIALSGVYLVKDDGVINPDNIMITQGGMITVASTGGALGASMAPLPTGRNFDIGQIVLDDLRKQIKKNLLDYSLPDMDGPVRSPTEFLARQREAAQDYGGAVYRIINESVVPSVMRVTDICASMGLVPPVKIDQFLLKVKVTSPMARAQRLQDTERVVQWLEILLKFIGQEGMILGTKIENVPAWLGDALGVPSDLVRSEDERLEMQEKIAGVAAAGAQQAAAQSSPQMAAA